MRRIDDKIYRELKPFVSIVGYKNQEDYYFESHSINKRDEGYVMGVGSPLTVECISEIASSFSVEFSMEPHGCTPSNLLYFDNRVGHQKYIWYNPPRKRMMYFTQSLNIEDGEYCVPGIIYVVNGEKLNVYAFKGKKPKNQLFKAPYFNVTDAAVCIGRAEVTYPSNPSFNDFFKYWEDKFWLTEFSHLGRNPIKGNLVLVTKKSKEKFDEEVLLLSDITLKDLLNEKESDK
ncbi:PRTRC genetic system protein B [Dysgonomonas hofstadii]|uniref:PRTRC genetic system protein B n=1 Tax=Dysgonomonas hofstadii TaxID=637886 RepID=A0A840CPH9_9BACT|nr:PRTRC system protein B [Dysgonomonas hofstadii]MBB4036589.1 PRTRC genetic system protein B [Dysgonomonas hofstadii]